MGIADLWPVVSAASDERLPFPVFLSRFLQAHGRPPRLAIDAYMFMFWSQLPDAQILDPLIHRRIIRNFMAKLWYLVQNNVLFVVVFDGNFKPGKLRHGHIPQIAGAISYDEVLRHFRTVSPSKYAENSSLIDSIKKILQRNCIDYLQAPAEAEAECAWLQSLGIVDFVVSDDSDTLVFGATQMLRMFNRVKYYEVVDGEKVPVMSSTDYYVTPIYLDHIIERTGLTRDRMLLIAVLRGGDYLTGSQGIGITRAKEIALCGTPMLLLLPRKALQDFGSLPDFTSRFVECIVDLEKFNKVLPERTYAMKSELERAEALDAFNEFLNGFLEKNAKAVFGRNTNLKGQVIVDEYYALLYFYPVLNPDLFRFTPHSVSFGELRAKEADLAVNINCLIRRINYICSGYSIGRLVITNGEQRFYGKHGGEVLERDSYALPRERKYLLKAFVLKLLAQTKFHSLITLARTREFDGVSIAVLKFQRVSLNEAVYLVSKNGSSGQEEVSENTWNGNAYEEGEEEEEAEDGDQAENRVEEKMEEDEDKTITLFVPLEAVRLVSPEYVREFENRKLPRKSPKKKSLPQKTTLDAIWPEMLPTKKPVIIKLDQAPPLFRGLLRESPKRKRKELLPGQSMVTNFFQNRDEGRGGSLNPFEEPIVIPSDEESDYVKFSKLVKTAPDLSNPVKLDLESSPETSPSKKVKREMEFSPEASPLKPKTGLPF